jgi:hypothetical protein
MRRILNAIDWSLPEWQQALPLLPSVWRDFELQDRLESFMVDIETNFDFTKQMIREIMERNTIMERKELLPALLQFYDILGANMAQVQQIQQQLYEQDRQEQAAQLAAEQEAAAANSSFYVDWDTVSQAASAVGSWMTAWL